MDIFRTVMDFIYISKSKTDILLRKDVGALLIYARFVYRIWARKKAH